MDRAPTRWIRTADQLDDLVDDLAGCRALGLDTEADSLHHYTEKVCLIQLTAFGGASWLVDPLAVRELGVELSKRVGEWGPVLLAACT